METVINFYAENITGDAMFEHQLSDFYLQNTNHPEPDDEDENEEENEADKSDDNPPIDKDINQAPVVTQPGTKPK